MSRKRQRLAFFAMVDSSRKYDISEQCRTTRENSVTGETITRMSSNDKHVITYLIWLTPGNAANNKLAFSLGTIDRRRSSSAICVEGLKSFWQEGDNGSNNRNKPFLDTVSIDLVVNWAGLTPGASPRNTGSLSCLFGAESGIHYKLLAQTRQLRESQHGWAGRQIAVKRQHSCVVCVDSSVRFCGRASRAGQPGPSANRQASGGLRSAAERAGETWRVYREQQCREKPGGRWVGSSFTANILSTQAGITLDHRSRQINKPGIKCCGRREKGSFYSNKTASAWPGRSRRLLVDLQTSRITIRCRLDDLTEKRRNLSHVEDRYWPRLTYSWQQCPW